jgi:predicted dehydrogenase
MATKQLDRRGFMKRAALTTAATSLSMYGPATRRVLGANDRILVGLIGSGRQGISNMSEFLDHGAQVVAICDVYQRNLQKGLAAVQMHKNPHPAVPDGGMPAGGVRAGDVATHTDFRRLLENKDIDVVINATPDHWHALPTIMACEAGKDVFVEKPTSVAVEEGKKIVEAARRYKRIVQVGLWQRSQAHFQKAVQIIRQGLIGNVSFVRTWNYSNSYPEGIGSPPDSDPPEGLDWDMWLGPAPKVPFNWNRFGVREGRWSTFRYFYDYANGWPGDWCIHLLDIVQWAMKVDGPSVISASGSKFCLKDNSDTPDTLQITFEYPNFVCTYENRLLNGNSMYGKGYGIEFHGTDGTMFLDRSGFQVFPEKRKIEEKQVDLTAAMQMEQVDDGLYNHVGNLLECMKTRNLPACDIETGHRSSSACLLGNVALRSRERIVWDVANQKLAAASPACQKLLSRDYRAPWSLPA